MSAVHNVVVTQPAPGVLTDPVGQLACTASIEITPRQLLSRGSLQGLLPAGSSVYVPLLPDAGREQTVAACGELVAQGMRPVAHLAARSIPSRDALSDWLAALKTVGVDSLLLIAGDGARPAGPFANTLDLLESGLIEAYGFRRLGVAGHPNGHPVASDHALREALAVKQDYARQHDCEMWMVTQFVFSAESALRWLDAIGEAAAPLTIRIGLPGPSKLRTLLAFAAQCGLGSSARMLMRRPDAARLVGGWTPEPVLRELAAFQRGPGAALLGGVHLYPFGGVRRCTEWLRGLCGAGDEPGTAPDGAGATRVPALTVASEYVR